MHAEAWGSEPNVPGEPESLLRCLPGFQLSFKSRRSSSNSSQSTGGSSGSSRLRKLSLGKDKAPRDYDSPSSGLRGSPSTVDTELFSGTSSTQCSISQPLSLTTRGPTSCPNLSTPDGSVPSSPRTSLITARHDQSEPLILPKTSSLASSLDPQRSQTHSLWSENSSLLDKSINSSYHPNSISSSKHNHSQHDPKEPIQRHASHDLSLASDRHTSVYDGEDGYARNLSQDGLVPPSNSSPLLLLTPAHSPTESSDRQAMTRSPTRPSRQRLDVVISQPETADSWQDSLLLNMLVNSTMVVGADSQPSSMENPMPATVVRPINLAAIRQMHARQYDDSLMMATPTESTQELLDQAVMSAASAAPGHSNTTGTIAPAEIAAIEAACSSAARDSGGGASKGVVVVAGVPMPVCEDGWPEGTWPVGLHGPMAPSFTQSSHALSWPYMNVKGLVAGGSTGMLAPIAPKANHSAPLQSRFKGRHVSASNSVHGGLVLCNTQDLMSIAEDQEEDE